MLAGVDVYRAEAARSKRSGQPYGAGTFVIPMSQVFARYAKDLLERQIYPEMRRGPNVPRRAALRRDRLVARHAVRRQRRLHNDAAAVRRCG